MGTAIVRCPNCSSVSNRTTRPDEYKCSHCGATFHFVRPADQLVTYDVRTHNCPVCGKHVEAGKGYRCVECGQYDVCESCVDHVRGKYLCFSCIRKEGNNCLYCGKYAIIRCVSCKGGACRDDYGRMFWKFKEFPDAHRLVSFECEVCRGAVCQNCVVERKELFSTKYICKNCGSKLNIKHSV